MRYYFVLWTIGLSHVYNTEAACGAYSTAETPDVKVVGFTETIKAQDLSKTECTSYCVPGNVSETTDCAITYIADDANYLNGPGDCFFYHTNCDGGCSVDNAPPAVVMVFTCTALDCGGLTPPTNGAVDVSGGTISGDIATYTCNTGYDISGSVTSTCGADGIWDSAAPVCDIAECGILTNPDNGTVTLQSGRVFGDQATYTCDSGFTLNGASIITCDADGNWDQPAPTCDSGGSGFPGCLALAQYPRSMEMRKSELTALPAFSISQTIQGINVMECVRTCTNQLSTACQLQNACLLAKYDVISNTCYLYYHDDNGSFVTCNAPSQCFVYEYYTDFV